MKRGTCLAWSEMTRPVFESAPDGLVPPEQQIDRLNRVAPVHPGPPHPPQADVVAGRMQATWPFFGACQTAGSEERSAATERRSVFSPRSLSIFRPCRSSRQGAVLLGHRGVSLHGNAKQIRKEFPQRLFLKAPPFQKLLGCYSRASRAGSCRRGSRKVFGKGCAFRKRRWGKPFFRKVSPSTGDKTRA